VYIAALDTYDCDDITDLTDGSKLIKNHDVFDAFIDFFGVRGNISATEAIQLIYRHRGG
jgi:hypothetical protein